MNDLLTTRKKGGRPRKIAPVDCTGNYAETRQFIQQLCETGELYSKEEKRMVPVAGKQLAGIILQAMTRLDEILKEEQRFKAAYLLKRYSTTFRTLDADQPAPHEVIIAEFDSKRYQVIVQAGYCHLWNLGHIGEKVCALNQITRWRPCVFTDKPVRVSSVKNDVWEALERGQAIKNGEKV
jgi:hypothetical protein